MKNCCTLEIVNIHNIANENTFFKQMKRKTFFETKRKHATSLLFFYERHTDVKHFLNNKHKKNFIQITYKISSDVSFVLCIIKCGRLHMLFK